MTKTYSAAAVLAAAGQHGNSLPGLYQTEAGRKFIGQAVSCVGSALTGAGFRGLSKVDARDLRALGLEIVTARYIGGRPGRFVDCLVIAPAVSAEG